jgi:hypothetical protein
VRSIVHVLVAVLGEVRVVVPGDRLHEPRNRLVVDRDRRVPRCTTVQSFLHGLPIRRAQKLSPELVPGQDDQLHPQALARSNALSKPICPCWSREAESRPSLTRRCSTVSAAATKSRHLQRLRLPQRAL